MYERATMTKSCASMLAGQVSANSLEAFELTDEHQPEVLAFLSERPLHTVIMSGFIRDHGLKSPLNRGSFYACRDHSGRIKGVALIGHATLVEARVDAALAALASVAQHAPRPICVMMGEQEEIGQFWKYYAARGQSPRLLRRELLYEQRWPVAVRQPVEGLRRATRDDLRLVIPAHARMAFEESGVNPLEDDPMGFRVRCERRIEQGRTWVLVEGGRLIFKADVVAETPGTTYLEGVYVNPEERDRGHGVRCVSQLSHSLLERTASICLLVHEQNRRAQKVYQKVGYRLRGYYDSIFLQR
ncbi:MAG TPA: GNAT family N-acetyltransferase [Pyrinomonadaceae bacterium]